MKRIWVLGLSMLIATVIAAASNASAQTNPQPQQSSEPPSARLVGRSGIVEVQRGNGWVTLNSGGLINPGERVRTGRRSSGAIELGTGKVVTLSESTEVLVRQSNGTPIVQLQSGNMKVVSAEENIQVAAKETVIESTERPVDIEVGYDEDGIRLRVNSGAVKNGSVVIRAAQDSSKRTYSAGGRRAVRDDTVVYPDNAYPGAGYPGGVYPGAYYSPSYFVFGNPFPLFPGSTLPPIGTVPPVVFNPTHPAYRPEQIIPPMSNPMAVPITPRAPVSPFTR